VLARAGGAAVRDDFAVSVERTLWFQVGVFGLSFLVMLLLPRGAGRHRPGSGEAGSGEAGSGEAVTGSHEAPVIMEEARAGEPA
jgi:hypothetical protein